MGTIDEKVGCVCVRWITAHKVDRGVGRAMYISEQGDLSVENWPSMETLEILLECVNALRANHEIDPTSKILRYHCCILHFDMNKFQRDCYAYFHQRLMKWCLSCIHPRQGFSITVLN